MTFTARRGSGWLLGWVLLLGSNACRSAAPSAPSSGRHAVAVAPVASTTQSSEAPSAAPGPCARLRQLSESARGRFSSHTGPPPAPCLEGKGGAYSFVISRDSEGAPDTGDAQSWTGQLEVLHADAEGNIARGAAMRYLQTGAVRSSLELVATVDYDADGVDELLVSRTLEVPEAYREVSAGILRVDGADIVDYAPAAGFVIGRFQDVDRDGRPDLVTRSPFPGSISGCGPNDAGFGLGPEWVAHAQADGGFAFDAVSHAELRRVCPERPATIVPLVAGGVDNDELRRRLACAVAWGTPPPNIARELQRQCPAAVAPSDECAYQGVLPVCAGLQLLVTWSYVQPPFVLP